MPTSSFASTLTSAPWCVADATRRRCRDVQGARQEAAGVAAVALIYKVADSEQLTL
jgi:hypothetical protein